MKLKAMIGNCEKEIEIKRLEEGLFVEIDGVTIDLDVSEPEPGTYLMKLPEGTFEAFVSDEGPDGECEVTIQGSTFLVGVFDPKRLRGAKKGAGLADGRIEIKSAMPGKIVKIIAAVGDEVKLGQGVIVVEAMKMQNELKSPKDGTVVELFSAVGDNV
ncbi:MAG: hypothetical protein OEM82_09165, partial [Acidobacteriota bacterium]|nr:hypothetical protein [Acidobacteriota bacterium]